MLFEPPFTDLSDQGITGVFKDNAKTRTIIKIIDQLNENAVG
jgi:type I restriction enzyme R subunit